MKSDDERTLLAAMQFAAREATIENLADPPNVLDLLEWAYRPGGLTPRQAAEKTGVPPARAAEIVARWAGLGWLEHAEGGEPLDVWPGDPG
jgi:DNA-binding IclR family transcriptional regulator